LGDKILPLEQFNGSTDHAAKAACQAEASSEI
jgi:hypothetical protein